MGITRKLTLALFTMLSLFQAVLLNEAIARSIDENSYYIFQASAVDGGYLYLQAQDEFVLIASEIIIPISLGSDTPSYQTPLGIVSALEGQELELRTTLPILSDLVLTDYLVGDVTGDGVSEIFVPALGIFITGLEGEHGGNPYVLAQYSEIDGTVINYYDALTNTLIVKPGLTFDLKDMNGDGRFDLVIKQAGKSDQVALAGTDGNFSSGSNSSGGDGTSNSSTPTYISGAIAGSFSVNQGDATYNIPLTLPAGAGGVKPDVSLSFSSSTGNGIMGVGWSLAAGSQISLCAKSWLSDGEAGGVLFNDNDRLCLDGQRLVAIKGGYWQDGTEYRTEAESYIRVIQHETGRTYNTFNTPGLEAFDGYGPAIWFETYNKAGDRMVYGSSDGLVLSKIIDDYFDVVGWALESVADKVGNSYQLNYLAENSGRALLSSIDYTLHEGGDSIPVNNIKINYESRPDKPHQRQGWSENQLSQRVASIDINVKGKLYREYRFGYEQRGISEKSYLTTVEECVVGNECVRPTVFTWEGVSQNEQQSEGYQLESPPNDFQTEDFGRFIPNRNVTYVLPVDYDGDGASELMVGTDKYGLFGGGSRLWLEDGSNCRVSDNPAFAGAIRIPGDYFGRGYTDVFTVYPRSELTPTLDKSAGYCGTDFLGWPVGGYGRFTLNNLSGLVASSSSTFIGGDFNGDGLSDILNLKSSGNHRLFYSNGDGSFRIIENVVGIENYPADIMGSTFITADFNGDGRTDVLAIDGTGRNWVGFGDIEGRIKRGGLSASNSSVAYAKDNDFVGVADFNGDGFSEFIVLRRNGNHSIVRTGNSNLNDMAPEGLEGHGFTGGKSHISLVDMNGDGFTDVLVMHANGDHWIAYSKGDGTFLYEDTVEGIEGKGFSADIHTDAGKEKRAYIITADFNGDGTIDILNYDAIGSKRWKVFYYQQQTKLTSIESGAGNHIDIGYSSGNQFNGNDIYHGGTPTSYPVFSVKNIGSIVASVKSSDGVGGVSEVSYEYWNQLRHLMSGATIGFQNVSERKGLYSTSIYGTEVKSSRYSQDYQGHQAGVLLSSSLIKNGSSVSKTINYYETQVIDADDNIIEGLSSRYNGEQGGANPGQRYFVVNKANRITQYSRNIYIGSRPIVSSKTREQTFGQYGEQSWSREIIADSEIDIDVDGNLTVPTSGSYFITETDNEYAYDNPSNWYLGKLSQASVTKSGVDAQGGTVEPITRTSQWTYDPATGGVASESIVLKEDGGQEHVDTITYHDVVLTHGSKSYPNFGVRNQSRLVEMDGTQEIRTTTTKNFSSPDGRFIVLAVDALGREVKTTYNELLGLKQTVTSPSGLISTYEYDDWGRPILVTNPDGTWATTEYHSCEGATICSGLVTPFNYIKSQVSGAGPSYAVMDMFGRAVRAATPSMNGQLVYTDKIFNQEGQAWKTSSPYFAGQTPQWTVLDYDFNDRLKTTTHPDGLVQTITYDDLTITYLNEYQHSDSHVDTGPRTQTITEFNDIQGSTYKTVDALNNTVDFTYDAYGHSLSTKGTDIEGAVTDITMAYDAMGRKTSMFDPSMGLWKYTYSKRGLLVLQTDANDVKICHVYDNVGRLVKRYDNYPMDSESDALQDCLGGGLPTAEWIYDTAPKIGGGLWIGQLHKTIGEHGYQEVYSYDELGRVNNALITVGDELFITTTVFDSLGRVKETYYPSANNARRLKVSNVYNSGGFLTELQKASGAYYWKADEDSMNARGQLTNEYMGNGTIRSVRNYNPLNGTVSAMKAEYNMYGVFTNDWNLQNDTVAFDQGGNVLWRESQPTSGEFHLSEVFTYDAGNRLKDVTFTDHLLSGSSTSYSPDVLSMSYKANGNIDTKYNMGTYSYGQACEVDGKQYQPSPHAVTQVTGQKNASYCYDDVGNLLKGDGRNVTWSAFNKPTLITKGNDKSVALTYGPSRSRIQRVDNVNGQLTTTTYLGGSYEKIEKSSGTLEEKVYIGGFAVITITDSDYDHPDEQYLLKDHIGSTVALVNEQLKSVMQGGISALVPDVQHLAFDPWGKRRNFLDWSAYSEGSIVEFAAATNRGFTGHEMLDPVGLVHMNGRVYDPALGRFLSADPIIQERNNVQNLNRYSYVMNNPLSYTDPSGFSFWTSVRDGAKRTIKDIYNNSGLKILVKRTQHVMATTARALAKNPALGTVVGIVGCAVATAACPLIMAAVAAATTYGGTGDWQLALQAGAMAGSQTLISAGVNNAIGFGFDAKFDPTRVFNTLAHGVWGGVFSEMRGGSFRSGAASGALAAAGANAGLLDVKNKPKGTFWSAVIGGTASRWTGGKFANGAITGAFGFLYNAAAHAEEEQDGVPHKYTVGPTKVCSMSSARCNMNHALDVVNEASVPIVGLLSGPPKDGTMILLGNNPITHVIDRETFTVWNITQDGHDFHPGTVMHRLYVENGNMMLLTEGLGRGANPNLNNIAGMLLFGQTHTQTQIKLAPGYRFDNYAN